MPPTPMTSLSLAAVALASLGGIIVRWNRSSCEMDLVSSDPSVMEPQAATQVTQDTSSIAKTPTTSEATTPSCKLWLFIAFDACIIALLVLRKLIMAQRSHSLAAAEASATSEGVSGMRSIAGLTEEDEIRNMDHLSEASPAMDGAEISKIILVHEAYALEEPTEEQATCNMDHSLALLSDMDAKEINNVTLMIEAPASVEPTEETEARDMKNSWPIFIGVPENEVNTFARMGETSANVKPTEKAGEAGDVLPMLASMIEDEVYKVSLTSEGSTSVQPAQEMENIDGNDAMLASKADGEVDQVTLMTETSTYVKVSQDQEANAMGDTSATLLGTMDDALSTLSGDADEDSTMFPESMDANLTIFFGRAVDLENKVHVVSEACASVEPPEEEEPRSVEDSVVILADLVAEEVNATLRTGASASVASPELDESRDMDDSLAMSAGVVKEEVQKGSPMTESSASVEPTEEEEARDMDDTLAMLAAMPKEKANNEIQTTEASISVEPLEAQDIDEVDDSMAMLADEAVYNVTHTLEVSSGEEASEKFEKRDTDDSLVMVATPTGDKVYKAEQLDPFVDHHLDAAGIPTVGGVPVSHSYLVSVEANGDDTPLATNQNEAFALCEEQQSFATSGLHRFTESWLHKPSIRTWIQPHYPRLAMQANVSSTTDGFMQNLPNVDACHGAIFQTPPRNPHAKLSKQSSAIKHDQKSISAGSKLETRFAKVFGKPDKVSPKLEQIASSARSVGGATYQKASGTPSAAKHDQTSASSRTRLEVRYSKAFAKPEKVLSKPEQVSEAAKSVGEAKYQRIGGKTAVSGFGSKSARCL